MQSRRVLLAFSLAATTASAAFADLIDQNSAVSNDRLGELVKTVQGTYEAPKLDAKIRGEQTKVINNEYLSGKYGTSTSLNLSSGSDLSWLVTHPLPDMARVSSNYGGRTMGGRAENHSGLDMSAPSGTPIYATGPGVVTKSGWGTGYGQYVEINHGNGYVTRYAHASRLVVSVGQNVKAGDHIANVGCTGRCTGPHLHYEVVKNGQRKNPSTYLAMLP
ncbi:M23 family metallopeptidase [Acinetobacter rudis]|uniref:M23 family metallopeptidase n=1 Tax=Acinetobacter rudis TaxID=632955 RepID=A0AAW8J471_9GAMM|nr:M23 family metallopeptidase [Acinetobacter rudis]MDQ8934237.1 M23 family metallopeptidase [Acinetobacter rudis]MDQ9016455.1 M23 family metallopeptidase [Acinetobacter rudis]